MCAAVVARDDVDLLMSMRSLKLLCATALLALARAGELPGRPAGVIPPGVVPQPQSVTYPAAGGTVTLAAHFAFTATGQESAVLSAAFDRYGKLLAGGGAPDGAATGSAAGALRACAVDVALPALSLDLQTEESYTLDLGAAKCTITSETVYGALHGMETLVQLFQRPRLTAPAVHIVDKPRFAFRATMIDTARHYYPLRTILQHLDAMAAVKMNVLHWHLPR